MQGALIPCMKASPVYMGQKISSNMANDFNGLPLKRYSTLVLETYFFERQYWDESPFIYFLSDTLVTKQESVVKSFFHLPLLRIVIKNTEGYFYETENR